MLRQSKEKEVTRKLRSCWENKVYVVLERISDLPNYVTKSIEVQLNSAKPVSHKQDYELQVSEY